MRIHPFVWLAWALAFVVLETIAMLNKAPNDTLTQTIVSYVPGWALFSAIGWGLWHFAVSYFSRFTGRPGR